MKNEDSIQLREYPEKEQNKGDKTKENKKQNKESKAKEGESEEEKIQVNRDEERIYENGD